MTKVEELGGLLKRIGIYNPELFESSFDDRLIFQKTVYLLQAFGLYLGYYFSWYIHGPYSTQLTKDGFTLIDKYHEVPQVRFIEDEDEILFREFQFFLGTRKNDAEWLEILASLHFLKKLYPTEEKEMIINKVMDKDPHFSRGICEEAWKYLKKFGLCNKK